MTVHSEWSKNTCLESLSQICSERLKSAPVYGGCFSYGKEKEGQREGWQKYLQKEVELLVINLSNFCPCILDAFWPLCISTENTVRNGTSAHLSCSATSFPHSCSKEFISSLCFTFHTRNFCQDPLFWGLCPALSTKPAHCSDLLLIFFFLSPSLEFLQVVQQAFRVRIYILYCLKSDFSHA